MKQTCRIYSLIFLTAMIINANVAFADKINFADETVARDVLIGKEFDCFVADQHMSGATKLVINEINGKSAKGSMIYSWCTDTPGKFNAKMKKNNLKFKAYFQSQTSNVTCPNLSGNIKFERVDEETFSADGKYRQTSGYNGTRGTILCSHY